MKCEDKGVSGIILGHTDRATDPGNTEYPCKKSCSGREAAVSRAGVWHKSIPWRAKMAVPGSPPSRILRVCFSFILGKKLPLMGGSSCSSPNGSWGVPSGRGYI